MNNREICAQSESNEENFEDDEFDDELRSGKDAPVTPINLEDVMGAAHSGEADGSPALSSFSSSFITPENVSRIKIAVLAVMLLIVICTKIMNLVTTFGIGLLAGTYYKSCQEDSLVRIMKLCKSKMFHNTDDKLNSSLQSVPKPKIHKSRRSISEKLKASSRRISEEICSRFVTDLWFERINLSDNTVFPDSVTSTIDTIILDLSERISNVQISTLFVEITEKVVNHAREFTAFEKSDLTLEEYIKENPDSLFARCGSKNKLISLLSQISLQITAKTLPKNEASSLIVYSFLQNIIACSVLYPLIKFISKPDWINENLLFFMKKGAESRSKSLVKVCQKKKVDSPKSADSKNELSKDEPVASVSDYFVSILEIRIKCPEIDGIISVDFSFGRFKYRTGEVHHYKESVFTGDNLSLVSRDISTSIDNYALVEIFTKVDEIGKLLASTQIPFNPTIPNRKENFEIKDKINLVSRDIFFEIRGTLQPNDTTHSSILSQDSHENKIKKMDVLPNGNKSSVKFPPEYSKKAREIFDSSEKCMKFIDSLKEDERSSLAQLAFFVTSKRKSCEVVASSDVVLVLGDIYTYFNFLYNDIKLLTGEENASVMEKDIRKVLDTKDTSYLENIVDLCIQYLKPDIEQYLLETHKNSPDHYSQDLDNKDTALATNSSQTGHDEQYEYKYPSDPFKVQAEEFNCDDLDIEISKFAEDLIKTFKRADTLENESEEYAEIIKALSHSISGLAVNAIRHTTCMEKVRIYTEINIELCQCVDTLEGSCNLTLIQEYMLSLARFYLCNLKVKINYNCNAPDLPNFNEPVISGLAPVPKISIKIIIEGLLKIIVLKTYDEIKCLHDSLIELFPMILKSYVFPSEIEQNSPEPLRDMRIWFEECFNNPLISRCKCFVEFFGLTEDGIQIVCNAAYSGQIKYDTPNLDTQISNAVFKRSQSFTKRTSAENDRFALNPITDDYSAFRRTPSKKYGQQKITFNKVKKGIASLSKIRISIPPIKSPQIIHGSKNTANPQSGSQDSVSKDSSTKSLIKKRTSNLTPKSGEPMSSAGEEKPKILEDLSAKIKERNNIENSNLSSDEQLDISAPVKSEDLGESVLVECIFVIILEFFQLSNPDNWIRYMGLTVLKSILLRTYGSTMYTKIGKTLGTINSQENISRAMDLIFCKLFPDQPCCKVDKSSTKNKQPKDPENVKHEISAMISKLKFNSAVEMSSRVMGKSYTINFLNLIFRMLQNEVVNQCLVSDILETTFDTLLK